MQRYFMYLACATALAATGPTPAASADDAAPAGLIPNDAAWGVVFDPGMIRDSALAQQTLDRLRPEQRDGLNDKLDGLSNMLGINLRQDLGQIAAFGYGYTPDQMAMAIDVGSAQGNIEGLLLAAENYQSYDYKDLIIHSIQTSPEEPRLYCAVVPPAADADGPNPRGVVLLSPNDGLAERLVDETRAGAPVAGPEALEDNEFIRVWVDRIPLEAFGEGSPQSNILTMIQSLEILGTTDARQTAMSLRLTTNNPARARQIFQMASGGKAFIEFAAGSDPDAAKLADLLSYIAIEDPEGGNVVSIRAFADTRDIAVVLDLLDEQGAFDELAK